MILWGMLVVGFLFTMMHRSTKPFSTVMYRIAYCELLPLDDDMSSQRNMRMQTAFQSEAKLAFA